MTMAALTCMPAPARGAPRAGPLVASCNKLAGWPIPLEVDWSRAPREALAVEVDRLFLSGLFTTQLLASFLRIPESAVWNARGDADKTRIAARG